MRVDLYFILALLALRAIFLALVPGILGGDGILYASAAQTVLQSGLAPDAVFQSRTYSVLIAPLLIMTGSDALQPIDMSQLTYGHPIAQAILYWHVMLDLVVVGIILSVYRKMRPDGVIWFRAGYVLIALQPFTAVWVNQVLPDQMCAAAFFIGLYLLARIDGPTKAGFRTVAGAAIALGLSGLLRIDMALLGLALIAAWMLVLLRPFGKRWAAMAICAGLAFATPFAMMGSYQYVSRGSFAYIDTNAPDNPDVQQGGYNAWTRAWVLYPHEFLEFVTGSGIEGWRGYDAAAFPDRAFASASQRAEVQKALQKWRDDGYSPAIDATFRAAATALRQERPAQAYLIAPMQRTVLTWVNPDGAAPLHHGLNLQPPWTKVATAIVALIKLMVGALAVLGIAALIIGAHRTGLQYLRSYPTRVAALAFAALVLRAIEMFAVNLLVKSPALESRYGLATWPGILVLSLYGLKHAPMIWDICRHRVVNARKPIAAS